MGAFDGPFRNAIHTTLDRVEVEDALDAPSTEHRSALSIIEGEMLEHDCCFASQGKRVGASERVYFSAVGRPCIDRKAVRPCKAAIELLSMTIQVFALVEGAECAEQGDPRENQGKRDARDGPT